MPPVLRLQGSGSWLLSVFPIVPKSAGNGVFRASQPEDCHESGVRSPQALAHRKFPAIP